jgi:hypothetical protein
MRLIVHAGFHKTGSTYLQHVMNDNHAALLSRGVFYQKQAGDPAHDRAAWAILRRDFSISVRMIGEARAAGCHTMILSSKALEGLVVERGCAAGLEQAALASGVQQLEWHFSLRDPGDYFASLYAELRHHRYTDPVAMMCEILREGVLLAMDPPAGGEGPPFQAFCFDHLRYLSTFAAHTSHPVVLHDFRDASPFPGWRILEAVGVLDALRMLPEPRCRNARKSQVEVHDGYCHQILRLLPDAAHRSRLRPMIEAQVRLNGATAEDYAGAIRARFAPGTAAALQIFACPGAEGQEPLRDCA